MEDFLTSIAPVFVVGLPIALLFFFRTIGKKKKKRREKNTNEFISSVSSKEFGINTKFLEFQFFQTVEVLVKGFYMQDPNMLPAGHMSPELYLEWYEKMKREYDLGIKKSVIVFDIPKIRIVKQRKISLNVVSSIEVEASFEVEYDYYHVTATRRIQKRYKQRFIFMSNNQSWYLDKTLQEEPF